MNENCLKTAWNVSIASQWWTSMHAQLGIIRVIKIDNCRPLLWEKIKSNDPWDEVFKIRFVFVLFYQRKKGTEGHIAAQITPKPII